MKHVFPERLLEITEDYRRILTYGPRLLSPQRPG